MEKLLDVRNMEVVFHTRAGSMKAIRQASFDVRQGEVMAIVGESGSGKSVLTQSCLRLIPCPPGEITGGEAIFEGKDLLKMTEKELLQVRGKKISVIFQDAMTALNPTMRIGQQIMEMLLEHARMSQDEAVLHARELLSGSRDDAAVSRWLMELLRPTAEKLSEDAKQVRTLLNGGASERAVADWLSRRARMTKQQAWEQAVELLNLVKIPDPAQRMDQYIFQCSGGMRQRVMIAMALACRPKLVIADEPTTALDMTIKVEILELLTSLLRELDTSIVLITHDLGMVASYATRIGIMYGGQFVETGTSREIFYETRHPYTFGLLRAVPRLDLPRSQTLYTIPGTPPNLYHMPEGCAFCTRCPYCMEICRQAFPPSKTFSETHSAYCWLYDPRAQEQRARFEADRRKMHGGEDR